MLKATFRIRKPEKTLDLAIGGDLEIDYEDWVKLNKEQKEEQLKIYASLMENPQWELVSWSED